MNIIKRTVLAGMLFFTLTEACFAQDFPLMFKSEFPVDAEWKVINYERTKVLAGDLSEIAMVDAKNGSAIWKVNFKEKFGQKKCNDWSWDEDLQIVKLIFKGDEKGQEKIILLDDQKGSVVEKGTERKVKPASGKTMFKTELSIPDKNISLRLSYKRPTIVSANKGRSTKIMVECQGALNWNTEIEGQIVRSLCSSVALRGFGGDFLTLDVINDKVFVIYEGISVLDLKTGKLLWKATFDNSEFDFGLVKQKQTLGRAAMPLVINNAVYIVDLSKNNYNIKKYDLENGTVLWQSEKFDEDAIVPELMVVGNTLVARFGGIIEQQTHIEGSANVPEKCMSEPKLKGDFGVKAYDLSSGKLLWQTTALKEQLADKFSGSISNLLSNDNVLFVASDKNLFAFDPNTGKAKFQVPVSKLKIGSIQTLFMHNNNLIAEGEEGVASFKPEDGKLNFAVNTDKCLGSELIGNAYIVWVGKSLEDRNKFVRMDIEKGTIYGKMSDTYRPWFTPDGEEFVKLDGQKMFRYKTK
jgi:outer membrane protein assembly factor BamB